MHETRSCEGLNGLLANTIRGLGDAMSKGPTRHAKRCRELEKKNCGVIKKIAAKHRGKGSSTPMSERITPIAT
jgi:hypothetical protein